MKRKIAIMLGVVCFLLVIAISTQVKTIENVTKEIGTTLNDNGDLIDEVLSWQSNYNNLYKKLEEAEKKLEKVRTEAITDNKEDLEAGEQIKENNKLLGLTEVKGSGVIITLDDNRNVNPEEVYNINTYLVHEQDLLQIVNELFNTGADAISINGQRVVSTTSIMCDGTITRVNDEKVGVPITIQAIGYPSALYYNLKRPQGYLDIMESQGVIVTIETSDNITIPKYDGVYTYEYIIGDDN